MRCIPLILSRAHELCTRMKVALCRAFSSYTLHFTIFILNVNTFIQTGMPSIAHIRDFYTLHDFSRDNGKYNGRSSECLSEAQFRYSVRTHL